MKIFCPYCGEPARWCENKEIYGKNMGRSYMCYLCDNCRAYVGCHNNTEEPLGTMANQELREWRKKAHAAIDPLWKSGKYTRSELYKGIRKYFGKEVHIGSSDLGTCDRLIQWAKRQEV